MEDNRIRKLTLDALGWYHATTPIVPGVRDPVRAFYKSFRGCGQPCERQGHQRFRACKKAVCYACSKRWSDWQATKFIGEFSKDERTGDHFRMITLGIGLYASVDECFGAFAGFRDRMRNTLDGKRSRKKATLKPELWKQFSLVGSLEIDLFRVDQFDKLGPEKKQSYLDEYGFDKATWKSDSVWVATFHGVAFLADLTEDEVRSFLVPYTRRVHIRRLTMSNSVEQEIQNILGYSVKTCFRTHLDYGREASWRQENIRSYIISAAQLRGRQPFKLYVGRK